MKIKIKAFGIAAEKCGKREWEQSFPDQVLLSVARKNLSAEFPALSDIINHSLALNQSYIHEDVVLKEGDEIAIIPPVSGG
jgi:molybdopterin converting factor small subunit